MLQDERIPSWINAWRTWKFGETQKQICVCKQLEKNIFASLVVVREISIFQRFGPICCLSHAALLKMEYFNLSIIMHKILWHTELMNVLNWGGKFNSCSNASCILKEDMNWIYVKRKWEQYSEGKKWLKAKKKRSLEVYQNMLRMQSFQSLRSYALHHLFIFVNKHLISSYHTKYPLEMWLNKTEKCPFPQGT